VTTRRAAGKTSISVVAQLSDFSNQLELKDHRPLVMMVEDDPAVAEMYKMGLEFAGFEVVAHEDGSAFFAALENQIPDVVILDFHLKGLLTGIDIAENLRLDERFGQLPVFFLSNDYSNLNGQVDRAFAAGVLAWLAKSRTNPSQLAARITQALSYSTAEERG